MGGEWDCVRLGDVATVRSGYAFKSKDWTTAGIPVVKIANVKEGRLDMTKCSYVSLKTAAAASEFKLKAGDILIAMTGYIGDVAIVHPYDIPCVLNQRVGRFSILNKNHLYNKYLFYFLRSTETRKTIEGLGYGSAQPNVSPSLIHGVEIPLPPIWEQRAIAYVLGTLDDKIELNRQMNRTLEAMAQALFKSWFIDFDPVVVNALLAGNPIPDQFAQRAALYRENPNALRLPEDTLRQFPDSFQDSELGPIPEGWEVRILGGVADVNWGDTYVTKKSYVKDGYLAYSAKGPDGNLPYYDYDRIGVVVSAIGANAGKTWLAQGKWSCIKNTIRFWSTDSELPTTYLFLATNDVHSWPRRGSAQPFISQGDARNIKVIHPGNKLGVIFDSYIYSAFEKTHNNLKESKRLSEVRDTLLPKLISGELRVPDAEKLLEDAL